MSPPERPDAEAPPSGRLPALVATFTRIAADMADLPFYNAALSIEAVGFQPFGSESLGVLITPWFMNLMLIPAQAEAYAEDRNGAKRVVEFPSGPQTFLHGGTEDFGMFWSRSLASPMDAYRSQPQVRAAARLALTRLLAPPPADVPDPDDAPAVSRRTLFSFAGRPVDADRPA
jgi:[NiFe] hydrogenase assembly HybE family chaperone